LGSFPPGFVCHFGFVSTNGPPCIGFVSTDWPPPSFRIGFVSTKSAPPVGFVSTRHLLVPSFPPCPRPDPPVACRRPCARYSRVLWLFYDLHIEFDASDRHFRGRAVYARSAPLPALMPVPSEDDEHNKMRDQQRRDPECRDPIGRPHEWSGVVDGGERNGDHQVERAYDVEYPDQQLSVRRARRNGRDRDQGQHGGQQVTERRGIGELRWNTGKNASRRQEHQAEVAQRMQQKNRQQHGLRIETIKSRQQIELRRHP